MMICRATRGTADAGTIPEPHSGQHFSAPGVSGSFASHLSRPAENPGKHAVGHAQRIFGELSVQHLGVRGVKCRQDTESKPAPWSRLPGFYLRTIGRALDRIDYVGDIDAGGLRIATAAAARSRVLGLPSVRPAPGLHAAMLEASRRLGHRRGWKRSKRRAADPAGLESLLVFLPDEVRSPVQAILRDGRRVPEEVLGPENLDALWSMGGGDKAGLP